MRKSLLSVLLAAVAVLSFAACHRGGGDETPAPTQTNPDTTTNPGTTNPTTPTNPATPVQILTGVFVDAPVEGLTFVSGAQTGTTDAAGGFKYEAGGTVQFKLGNVVLGQAPGKALITPIDLVKVFDPAADAANPRVLQIVQFLMTVNANPISAPTMSMSSFAATNAASVAAVDLSATLMDQAALTNLLAAIVPAKTLVTTAEAAAHLQAALAALTAPKAGVFVALDSTANPTVGLRLSITPNAVGNGFDVGGVAAKLDGSTWNIGGTLSLTGSLQATGGGNGTPAPPDMTITGSVASATQLSASVSFANNALKPLSLILEKSIVPVAPKPTGKLALATDPGTVNTILVPLTQIQHIAGGLTILPDGQVSANLVEGEITGIAVVASVLGGRFAVLSGVTTSAGNIIAFGGNPGFGETIVSRSITPPSPIVFMVGAANNDGTVSATVTAQDLTGGGLTVPPLSFVAATNALAGVYAGTLSDVGNPPGPWAFGVNNDGSVHGFANFLTPGKRFPNSGFLIDGSVDAATGNLIGFAPAGFPAGLQMTDDEANTAGFVGTWAGTINPASGAVTGTWNQGPLPAVTGSYTGNLLP